MSRFWTQEEIEISSPQSEKTQLWFYLVRISKNGERKHPCRAWTWSPLWHFCGGLRGPWAGACMLSPLLFLTCGVLSMKVWDCNWFFLLIPHPIYLVSRWTDNMIIKNNHFVFSFVNQAAVCTNSVERQAFGEVLVLPQRVMGSGKWAVDCHREVMFCLLDED